MQKNFPLLLKTSSLVAATAAQGQIATRAITALFGSYAKDARYVWGTLAYELLVVLDMDAGRIYRAYLPQEELRDHIDVRARYTPDTIAPHVLGMIIGAVVMALLFYVFWQFWFPRSTAFILAGVFGVLAGIPIGLIGGPKLGPRPMWVVRRSSNGKKGSTFSPVLTRLAEPEWTVGKKTVEGGEVRALIPQIDSASGLYEATEARDEHDMWSTKDSNWEKLEMGLIVTLLVCMVAVLFLIFVANGGN